MWSLVVASLLAHAAEDAAFRRCTISVGQVFTCEATAFTGDAPIEVDGVVRECSISVGVPVSCPKRFTGETVLDRGKVVRCEVQTGFVTRCDATGFTGDAVLLRAP